MPSSVLGIFVFGAASDVYYNACMLPSARVAAMLFSNPFPGKRSPLNISGLFLFDPSVQSKLDGLPFRFALEEQLGAAMFKRMDRAMKSRHVAPEFVDELLAALPENGSPFVAMLRAARAGDAEAEAAVEAFGVWESFYAGFTGPLGYRRLYRMEIERACREPTAALRRGKFDVAVDQLLSNPVTSVLLWREAVDALDGKTAVEHLAPLQFAGALEVELSCLAALDAQLQVVDGHNGSTFAVLVSEEGAAINPAAMFFRWVAQNIRKASLSELDEVLQRLGCGVNLTTLKDWNRGKRLPSVTWLKLIAKERPQLANGDELWILYWAAKTLMMLGYYGTLCANRVAAETRPIVRSRQRPWPAFPYGHSEFGDWLRARYPVWLAYHRARIETSPT
jgi:hypothetical protein